MTKHCNEYGVENIAGTEKALWNLIEKSTSGQMRTNCNETDQNLKMSKFFIHLVWMCPIFTWTQSNHGLQQPHYSKNLVVLLSHLKTCKGSNLKAFMIENVGLILTKKKYTQPVTRCCFTDRKTLRCLEESLASFAHTLCFPVTWMLYLQ